MNTQYFFSKKSILAVILLIIFSATLFITPLLFVSAQTDSGLTNTFTGEIVPCNTEASGNNRCNYCDLFNLAQNIINFLVFFVVLAAVSMFVYAGFLYITGATDPNNITKAHRVFASVIIGLVLTLTAWLIVDTIMKTLTDQSGGFGPWNPVCTLSSITPSQSNGVSASDPASSTDPAATTPTPSTTVLEDDELGENEARLKLSSAGIPVNKSPCPDGVRYQDVSGGCTTLNGVKKVTIDGTIALKRDCGCSVTVTGVTELGHQSGVKSHENGYKVDLSKRSSSLNTYINSKGNNFSIASSGITYTYTVRSKSNHWDILIEPRP